MIIIKKLLNTSLTKMAEYFAINVKFKSEFANDLIAIKC